MSRTRRKANKRFGFRKPSTLRTLRLACATADELNEHNVQVNSRWSSVPTAWDDIYVSAARENKYSTTKRKLARIGNIDISSDNRRGWLLISTDLNTDLSISACTPLANRSMCLGNMQGRYVYAIKGYTGHRWRVSTRNQPKGWLSINEHTFTAQQLWDLAK